MKHKRVCVAQFSVKYSHTVHTVLHSYVILYYDSTFCSRVKLSSRQLTSNHSAYEKISFYILASLGQKRGAVYFSCFFMLKRRETVAQACYLTVLDN